MPSRAVIRTYETDDWESRAVVDRRDRYRYSLWYGWNATAPQLTFVMLNPSTANEKTLDPTVRRCFRFAQAWGYGSVELVNLFALRTPYPALLKQAERPVGVLNDEHLLAACQAGQRVIIAWGNEGSFQGRDRTFLALCPSLSSLYCLGVTQQQQPRHPLYVRRDVEVIPWGLGLAASGMEQH